jgi:hypothetical protein
MPQATSGPKGPGKREVRKQLAALSKEALLDEVMRMYSDFAPVREYLSMRVSPDDAAVRTKYRRIIEKEFTVSRTRGPRISVARKAVLDYRKVAPTEEAAADMMLFYVEQAEAFAYDVGGDEALYASAWRMYRDALDLIVKHDVHERFRERSRRLARREHGYGFQDELASHHHLVFGEDIFLGSQAED